jgi:transforming growth factor-beta-induced protein
MRIIPPTKVVRGAIVSLSLVLATAALTTSLDVRPASAQQQNIVQLAQGNPQLSTLVRAVQAANLVDTLSGPGPFTVFAPNDAAFQKVPADALNQTLQDQPMLRSVLTYHVTAGRLTAAELAQRGSVPSVQGGPLNIGAGPSVNGVRIVQADVAASNGIVHVIETVLTPPGAGNMAGMAPAPGMGGQMGGQMGQPGQLPRSGVADVTAAPLALAGFGLAVLALGALLFSRRPSAARAPKS